MKRFLVVSLLLTLAACTAPEPQARIRIAGGEKLVVALRSGRVEGAENKFVKPGIARFLLGPQAKNGLYDFGLIFTNGAVPTKIVVEDVADSKAVVLLTDEQPVLDQQQRWRKLSEPVDLSLDSMKWLHDIDDSFRVYRFSVNLKDGQKIVFHHAAVYPSFFKVGLMQAMEAQKAEAQKTEAK